LPGRFFVRSILRKEYSSPDNSSLEKFLEAENSSPDDSSLGKFFARELPILYIILNDNLREGQKSLCLSQKFKKWDFSKVLPCFVVLSGTKKISPEAEDSSPENSSPG
jgi:hypothetical protein